MATHYRGTGASHMDGNRYIYLYDEIVVSRESLFGDLGR